MSAHFFYSWTKQDSPTTLDISSTTSDTYICKDSNNEIYDLSSCSYHLSFGLRNSEIIDSIKEQYDHLPAAGPKANFSLKDESTKKLLNYLKLPDGKIFYTTSGAEAIENALKMARHISGKKYVIARENAYHGATTGAMSVGGDWRSNDHLTLSEYTLRIPSKNTDKSIQILKDLISTKGKENIAAIVLETITGGNGVIDAEVKWWKEVQKICKDNEIFIILDEIVCGFGRTGENFAFHHYPVKPDFVCMAKNITGGFFPFGALYVDADLASFYDSTVLSCGTTNYAHPVGLKICSTIIDILSREAFKDNLLALEDILINFSKRFSDHKNVNEVRRNGLLMAVDLNTTFLNFSDVLKQGLYVNYISGNIIICPIYTTTPKKLTAALDKLYTIIEGL